MTAPESLASDDLGSRDEREQRGFALYVGLSEGNAREGGIDLIEMVDALRDSLKRTAPNAESQALAVIADAGTLGRDLDVVMQAIGKQAPTRTRTPASTTTSNKSDRAVVVIDLERHHVLVDNRDIHLTFKELTILEALVTGAGRTLNREQLRYAIATTDENDIKERTIDVHVRRMRAKFGSQIGLIETVHRTGYRFSPRHNTVVRQALHPRSEPQELAQPRFG